MSFLPSFELLDAHPDWGTEWLPFATCPPGICPPVGSPKGLALANPSQLAVLLMGLGCSPAGRGIPNCMHRSISSLVGSPCQLSISSPCSSKAHQRLFRRQDCPLWVPDRGSGLPGFLQSTAATLAALPTGGCGAMRAVQQDFHIRGFPGSPPPDRLLYVDWETLGDQPQFLRRQGCWSYGLGYLPSHCGSHTPATQTCQENHSLYEPDGVFPRRSSCQDKLCQQCARPHGSHHPC
ncbi:hypothetical protein KIL84_010929 [Mauremys mutica]|uniref:Uncharacterized protein n=1 Tax=Mauremys mutica TaxID=74926 RepID=A0A9D3XCU7_9SAUR|nr:hypothetical protein KIL84_010929 [Mauremys mutica]